MLYFPLCDLSRQININRAGVQVCDHYNNFSACEEKQKDFTTGNADLMKVKYGTWRRERKRPRKQGSVLCSKK